MAVGTDVLLHQVDTLDREIHAIATGIFKIQVVTVDPRDRQMAQAVIMADPVVHMDDVISRLCINPIQDQLQLQRLKKRKLHLKDQIAQLERQLTPDIPA